MLLLRKGHAADSYLTRQAILSLALQRERERERFFCCELAHRWFLFGV